MRVVEHVEGNLQNIFGVATVEKQYRKYARYVARKHFNNSILHASF